MSLPYENMKPNEILYKLRNSTNDVPIFRRLINFLHSNDASVTENTEDCEAILKHIIEIISDNSELGNERILLACHTFYALLSTCDSNLFLYVITQVLELKSPVLHCFGQQYVVSDVELFKLSNVHGYLQSNRKDTHFYNALNVTFDVIYKHCLRYTKYFYFAYKVLHMWLKRTSDTHFWQDERNIILERKLEAIIFSNWISTLNDVTKQNAQIFNMYLRIMSEKYNGFLDHIFEECVERVSWQNETKFTILTEVCQLWNNIETMTNEDFLHNLCVSLMHNSLRCGATKVYLVISRKLNENEWKERFGRTIKIFVDRWESEKYENHNALRSLFKYWLEPTIEMHRDILTFLWELQSDPQVRFFRSHLLMTAARLCIKLPYTYEIDSYLNDIEEIVRLNAFAVLCYHADDSIDIAKADPFFRIRQFLWFNANAATVFMREEIVKYFQIFYSNILRTISVKADCARSICEFTEWLHEYLLDCFEIGSSYQHKILALNLNKVLLSFTNGDSHKTCTHHLECLRNVKTIKKYLKTTNSWKFTNKKSLFVLLRLVLDSTLDVRQLATALILKYFKKDMLSAAEKRVFCRCALEYCNSSKFYKIESGAALMKIIAHWLPLNEICEDSDVIFPDDERKNILACSSYSEFLLDMARHQLIQMKSDILKAIVQNKPFYGALTALLSVAFRSGPENCTLTSQLVEEVLHLSKDAVSFFLSMLFVKQSDTAYSSSFAEMGLAIDEKIRISEIDDCNYDELQLSPAHQVLISCIWTSLKVLCEIVSEIGMLIRSDEEVKCCMDIIVTVLLKCRHKGVVESAGMAIANLSRCLYGKKKYCKLPKTYLMNLLEEDTDKLLHLTRRGAGLSIMFHRLVVSDNRRDRPTMHFAVRKLLSSLEKLSVMEIRHVKTEQDTPCARWLHFLRALVSDKEIYPHLVPYMAEICLKCFVYIESDVWSVRNASLQLYGAVVPRMTGQCSGNRKDTIADFADGCSLNYFITHYPTLANRILQQLRTVAKIKGTSDATLRSYAKVTHMLILLSRMWTGGCGLVDYPTLMFTNIFLKLLSELRTNPMMHVRQLAAKAYAALVPSADLEVAIDTIRQAIYKNKNDNWLYGSLLTINHLMERLTVNSLHATTRHKFNELKFPTLDYYNYFCPRYLNILKAWQDMNTCEPIYNQPCYMLETLFLQKMRLFTDDIALPGDFDGSLSVIEHVTSSQKIQPGFYQFLGLRAQLYASHIKQSDPEILHNILNSNCIEQSIGFLNGLSYSVSLLESLLKYLISMKDNHHQLLLDEIVMLVLKMIKDDDSLRNMSKFDVIIEEFNELETTVTTNSKVIHVKNALILAFSSCERFVSEILSHVLELSTDDEQSVRLTATEYAECALRRYLRLGNQNRSILMRCCLILLKDEIAEIRHVISISLQKYVFYDNKNTSSVSSLQQPQHEELVYQWLLRNVIAHKSPSVVNTFYNNDVDFICYFTSKLRNTIDSNIIIENPFYHDDTTFYEESKFLNFCYLYAKFRKSGNFSDNRNAYEKDCYDATCAIQTGRELRERASFNYDDLQTVLYTREIDYLIRKRNIVIQNLLV